MRAALLCCALALAGCEQLTYLVISVDSTELGPADIDSLTITVTNPDDGPDGGTVAYQRQSLRLCKPGERRGCYSFPITVALRPGQLRPSTRVRVVVDAFDPAGAAVTSDAAVFSFTPEARSRLDFFLYRSCLGTDCAAANLACGASGGCGALHAREDGTAPPDLALPPSSGEIARITVNPGTIDGNSGYVTPPVTEPGDLVLLGLFAITDLANLDFPGWRTLSRVNKTSAVLYRFAEVGEGDDPARYQLTFSPSTYQHQYVIVVYRGARRVRAGTSVSAPPLTFAPVVDLAPGGVVVGALVSVAPMCVDAPPIAAVASSQAFSLFEVRPTGPGPSPAFDVACTTNSGSQNGDLYQIIVEP